MKVRVFVATFFYSTNNNNLNYKLNYTYIQVFDTITYF